MVEEHGSYFKYMSQSDREELLKKLKNYLEVQQEIIFAYVFGSFASEMPFQDIDLALYVELENFEQTRELENKYADLLGMELNENFHVIVVNNAPSAVLCSIFSEGRKLISRDENLLEKYIERCSLDMLANENIAHESLREIVQ